ncbi:MAG TPA: xanthan lyase [Rikenellaceae bacterium]|nr:xanthan lyase [Rikenellaceae bacterium]
MKKIFSLLLISFMLIFSAETYSQTISKEFAPIADTLQKILRKQALATGRIRVDSAIAYKKDLVIYFSNSLAEYPFREDNTELVYSLVKSMLPEEFSSFNLRIVTNGLALEELIPPFYNSKAPVKSRRAIRNNQKELESRGNLVKNSSKPYTVSAGLNNRHIAVWQSHGYYYEQKLLRWEWQRARIFQTVEDLYTQSYVVPFLVPMLENAGAVVMMPRERDVQKNEVIVDNNSEYSGYAELNGLESWYDSSLPGFHNAQNVYITGENPFQMGTARVIRSIKKGTQSYAHWKPLIPETGEYAVYVSYHSFQNSTQEAKYTVKHAGGETHFTVNQRMGGGTWIYLGTFLFSRGDEAGYEVSLSNLTSKKGEIVSADAVKFGGGMGNIARKPATEGIVLNRPSSSNEPLQRITLPIDPEPIISNYPRFTEGARYWLQWAGYSDTIYSPNKNTNDYNDDYMSRGKWVNVISGGSVKNPQERGLNIPVDLAMAFHTDAGTTLNDSIIGTLGIFTRFSNGSDKFPTGEPRFNGRYLTDLIQTQIVEDIKQLHEPIWQRRGIWDRSYSESRSPVVPTMLLELLSHQNFADMRYGLDPTFRFDVSRAIYKGMLKYLSQQSGLDYIVQPLPVKEFSAITSGQVVTLKWSDTEDKLEPTAKPEGYIVYTRVDGAGFDNGTAVTSNKIDFQIETGKIYSFKITAFNTGGESFPSEILSVYKSPQEKGNILIINAFNRVAPPHSFASSDTSIAGFFDYTDNGVAYLKDVSFIGSQYEFRRSIPWMDDDSPGFGSSYANYETEVIAGNSFDYPFVHGKAFAMNGYSFVSVSSEALLNGIDSIAKYDIIDIVAGKQIKTVVGRSTNHYKYEVFPKYLRDFIAQYSQTGGNILVSGAFIATDLWESVKNDKDAQEFARNTLKYQWRTNWASKTGEVKAVQSLYDFKGNFSFHTTPNSFSYSTEAPDGIEPVGPGAWTIFRYSDNNISAGIAYKGDYKTVSLGFPLETLKEESQLNNIIEQILKFFETK